MRRYEFEVVAENDDEAALRISEFVNRFNTAGDTYTVEYGASPLGQRITDAIPALWRYDVRVELS